MKDITLFSISFKVLFSQPRWTGEAYCLEWDTAAFNSPQI